MHNYGWGDLFYSWGYLFLINLRGFTKINEPFRIWRIQNKKKTSVCHEKKADITNMAARFKSPEINDNNCSMTNISSAKGTILTLVT